MLLVLLCCSCVMIGVVGDRSIVCLLMVVNGREFVMHEVKRCYSPFPCVIMDGVGN